MNNNEYDFESFENLLRAMRDDPVINEKVVGILKMDSHPRHIVLSNWLEQLRRNNAPYTLLQSLTFLFDDSIARKVLTLINDNQIQNT